MKAKYWKSAVVVFGVAMVAGFVAYAERSVGAAGENDQAVSIDQVPAVVKATLLKEAGSGTIKEIELDDEDGKAVYEAEVIIEGQKTEIKIADDGTLLSKQADDENENEEEDGQEDD
jgi:hypothetical protein